jgi:uncharacterized protein YaaW (UPF0174 family)
MPKNKPDKHSIPTPIERHSTAAWASVESIIPESRVTIPPEFQVANAKKHVDANQK